MHGLDLVQIFKVQPRLWIYWELTGSAHGKVKEVDKKLKQKFICGKVNGKIQYRLL